MFKELKYMLRGLSRKNAKAWPKSLSYYLLGIGSAIVLGMILETTDPLPTREQAAILEQWKIYESEEGLVIPFKDIHDIFWQFNIAKKSNSDAVDKFYLIKDEKDIIFSYLGLGEKNIFGFENNAAYNSPLVSYGWLGPDLSGCLWKDLNFDRRFDERYISGRLEILIEDEWVQGVGVGDKIRQIKTDRGVFEFNEKNGKWVPVSG